MTPPHLVDLKIHEDLYGTCKLLLIFSKIGCSRKYLKLSKHVVLMIITVFCQFANCLFVMVYQLRS